MGKIKGLVQIKNFKWLLKYAKPFRGIIIAILLINMASSVISVGSVVISKQMVDSAVYGIGSNLVFIIILFIAVQAVSMALGAIANKISLKLNEKMSYQIQNDVLEKIYKSDWKSLSDYHSGDVLTRLTDDIDDIVYLWVVTLPGIISLGVQLVLAFAVLMYFDAILALLAFVLGPVAILVSFLLGLKMKKLQHEVQEAESQYRSYITELLQHILIVKSFQYERSSMDKVEQFQSRKYRTAVKRNNMGIMTNLLMSGGFWLSYAVAFVYGVFKLSLKTATFGTFTAFLQLVNQIQSPFIGLARNIPQLISSFASVERLIELEEIEDEEKLSEKKVGEATIEPDNQYGVEINDVTFGYDESKKIFKNSNFIVEKGRIVAIIGSSGEGKTTIMRLLLGLIRAEKGGAFISDDHNKTPVSASSRGFFSYVPQGNTLFSGSIKENLLVGKLNATENELEEALRAACAWDFIKELPEKIDTLIGEGATGLSEGQAQRICIARALLRDAPVLLLDEATSALDMETEKQTFENIKRMSKKTCIVITHRLSVLPLCDSVYRLENGTFHKHEIRDFSHLLVNESS